LLLLEATLTAIEVHARNAMLRLRLRHGKSPAPAAALSCRGWVQHLHRAHELVLGHLGEACRTGWRRWCSWPTSPSMVTCATFPNVVLLGARWRCAPTATRQVAAPSPVPHPVLAPNNQLAHMDGWPSLAAGGPHPLSPSRR
jgi:hypothetical protein